MSQKLDDAFERMEICGLIAKQNLMCCQRCGIAECCRLADEWKKSRDPATGYCFYHEQDTEAKNAGKPFHLAFGIFLPEESPEEERAAAFSNVVTSILSALDRYNISYEWHGDLTKRIKITSW